MTNHDVASAPHSDLSLLEQAVRYNVALFADALDQLARYDQVMAPRMIQMSGSGTMAGFAVTVAVGASHRGVAMPYEKEFEAIELLRDGSILVASTDGPPAAFWGELLTERARKLGARGAIVDGYARDLARIRKVGFPVWARGANACDSAGRLEAYAVGGTVMCGGVLVSTGDLIVSDCDGIVVVPRDLIADTLSRVAAKARTEDDVRAALARGASTFEVYGEFGIL